MVIHVLHNVSPHTVGYPILRSRFGFFGARDDICKPPRIKAVLASIRHSPMALNMNWRSFLVINDTVVWSRLHCAPTADELTRICQCTLNPLQRCPAHPCRCKLCKRTRGRKTPTKPTCQWQKKAVRFMKTHCPQLLADVDRRDLTYVDVLELQGLATPSSARERHMLNVFSHLPRVLPMRDSLAIFDLSQAIDWVSIRTDGVAPTVATQSILWSMRDGKSLSVTQVAELMGHRLRHGTPSFDGVRKKSNAAPAG